MSRDDLVETFRGGDAIVHLAFVPQPMRDPATMRRINVGAARRVLDALTVQADLTLLVTFTAGA